MANEDQTTEIEVLQSIYEGDPCFHQINDTTFQYKFGEDGDKTSFLLEVSWPPDYPQVVPNINFNAFYNNHISNAAKSAMLAALNEEAQKYVGDPQVYTLFEWARDGLADIMQSAEPPEISTLKIDDGTGDKDSEAREHQDEGEGKSKGPKQEQMTKSQKRRAWNRMDNKGELIRGHNWIDVIKHLSQTGGKPLEVPNEQPPVPTQ